MTPPPFFVSKIMNLLVFFYFEPKKVFPGPNSMGFVWGRVGRAQFMHFSAIFAMLLRRLKLHGIKRQKVPKIHGLKKHQKNHSLVCKKSSRFWNTKTTLM